MKQALDIIENARSEGRRILDEYESKRILNLHGIPVVPEKLVFERDGAQKAAKQIGYPVALKVCSHQESHKTEKGLVCLGLKDEAELSNAYQGLEEKLAGGEKRFLVQQMVKGNRELLIGMTRDHQFGPVLMFGLGGIFTEVLKDVSYGIAPLSRLDALDMLDSIRAKKILSGIRGLPEVDRTLLADSLAALGEIGMMYEDIQEIDVNPLIIQESRPVAVDALIVLKEK